MNGSHTFPMKKKEDYSSLTAVGLVLALVMLFALGFYWLGDGPRLQSAAASLAEGRVQRGQELYNSQCAACHGDQGQGGVGAVLKNRAVLKSTPDQVFFSVIRSGVPNTQMPSWSVDFGGPLTDENIHDLVALLRSWEATAPEILPVVRQPDPALGALLFTSTCALCHGENGQGGKEGVPALNDTAKLSQFDDTWYRGVISNGRPAKGMPTWGTVFSPAQIDDLVALLGAWRRGQVVSPAFSMASLLDQALYALSVGDVDSAQVVITRALGASTGQAASILEQAAGQVKAHDLTAASQTLTDLKQNWPPGDAQTGGQAYAANCAACHGPQGEGGVGLKLQASVFVQGQTNADLVAFIQNGRPGTIMTGWADRMSEQEIANIVAWMRGLQNSP